MRNFLEGIGPFPLPFPDVDPQDRMPAEPFDEYEREVERSASFMVVAEREGIGPLCSSRAARHSEKWIGANAIE